MTDPWAPVGARELRVGLIGLGSMGRKHMRILGDLSGVRLVAVADPDTAVVTSATAGSPIQAFDEPVSMLSEVDLDAVVIASPTSSHGPLTLAAIECGVAVLVEKPLAATVAEADRIEAAASAPGAPPIQVGHVERFNPGVIELARLVETGWLSRIIAISSQRVGPVHDRIRDVGVTVDLATHDVDILCAIAGERPARVSAETASRMDVDREDLLFGLLSFPSGIVAKLEVDWLTPSSRRRLTVLGEEGVFELDFATQRLTFMRSAATKDEDGLIELPVPTSEPLTAQLASFVRVVRSGSPPLVDVTDGHSAVVLVDALLKAARERRTVHLAPA